MASNFNYSTSIKANNTNNNKPVSNGTLEVSNTSADVKSTNLVQFRPLCSNGPKIHGHVMCTVNDSIYIHGGMPSKNAKIPNNQLFKFDFQNGWQDITPPNSPALSNHCVVVEENNIILIGGWNGNNRVCDIYVYNVLSGKMSQAVTRGFPNGAGLSGHTCTRLKDGRILVFGREGSLRTQRKYGNCFMLQGNVQTLKYSYESIELDCTSRSGHVAISAANRVILIGGRKDKLVEIHSFPVATVISFNDRSHTCFEISSRIEADMAAAQNHVKSLKKEPGGRRGAACIQLSESVCVLHGGETFDSNFREPCGDLLVLNLTSFKWYSLGSTGVNLQNHSIGNLNGRILVHGGLTNNNQINNTTYELCI